MRKGQIQLYLYEEVAVTCTSQERGMFGHFANWGKYLFLRGSNFAVVQELNMKHILLANFTCQVHCRCHDSDVQQIPRT